MWPYYLLNPFRMLIARLRRGKFNIDWPQFRGRSVILTHLARIAIARAYRMLGLSPGDEILVPAYNCGSEIDPLLKCGAKTILYRVDSGTMIDPQDIQSRVTAKTRALLVIHYFGWPQSLEGLAKWCKERNIFLIEDCALSLFSKGPEGPLGTVGDAAIHCFWKTFPVPDGGALTFPGFNIEKVETMRPPGMGSILRKILPFYRSWLRNQGKKYFGPIFQRSLNLYRAGRFKVPVPLTKEEKLTLSEVSSEYYFDERIRDWSISRLSMSLMSQIDPHQVIQARRRNYKQLYERIQDLPGLRFLFDSIPEGICPLVMPILVSNPHEWQRSLSKRDVLPIRWWRRYHRSLSWDEFPEAQKLKNHLLTFHVDQYLDENNIEYMANSIREVALRLNEEQLEI